MRSRGDALGALVSECARLTMDVEAHRSINALRMALAGGAISAPLRKELRRALEEARDALRAGQEGLANVHLMQAASLLERREDGTGASGGGAGLFGKLKGALTRRGKPEARAIRERQDQANADIYRLQQLIVRKSAERERLMEQLRTLAARCAGVDRGSTEYRLCRAQAAPLQVKVEALDRELAKCCRALENNAQYASMLESGLTDIDLKNYVPDPAELQVMMERITEASDAVTTDIAEGSEAMRAWRESAVPEPASDGGAAFDALVAEEGEKLRAAGPDTAASPTAEPPSGASHAAPTLSAEEDHP